MMEGPGADSEEKHEPVSDIDTVVVVVGLKALDPEWPIREANEPIASFCCETLVQRSSTVFSPAVYRVGNLSENLSVALDQKFGQAKITPPEAGPRCRRLRTGSKRSACPNTRRD